MPRGIPNRKPEPVDDDEVDQHPIVQRVQPAAGHRAPPTRAAASVFAMGQAAKAKRTAPIRVDDVTIQRGVPLPEVQRGGSPYKALLERMAPGDMVALSARQAYGLMGMAKKLQIAHARRTLPDGNIGVWRL